MYIIMYIYFVISMLFSCNNIVLYMVYIFDISSVFTFFKIPKFRRMSPDMDDFIPPAPPMQAPGLPPVDGAQWESFGPPRRSQGGHKYRPLIVFMYLILIYSVENTLNKS